MQNNSCFGDGLTITGLEAVAVRIATWRNQAGDGCRRSSQRARQIAEGPVNSHHGWLRRLNLALSDDGQQTWQGRRLEKAGDTSHWAIMRIIIILPIFVVPAITAVPHPELHPPEP